MSLPLPVCRQRGARGALRRRVAFLMGAARLSDLERHEALLALGLYARSAMAYDVDRQTEIRTVADVLRSGRRRPVPEPLFSERGRRDVEVGAH